MQIISSWNPHQKPEKHFFYMVSLKGLLQWPFISISNPSWGEGESLDIEIIKCKLTFYYSIEKAVQYERGFSFLGNELEQERQNVPN